MVKSFSDKKDINKVYTVESLDFQDGIQKWVCSCPHWIFRVSKTGGRCKHILFVVQHNKEQERLQEEMLRGMEGGCGMDWGDLSPKNEEYEVMPLEEAC